MSIKVMNYVWDHSDAQGTELLCLLAIADNANDDGEAFPGIARIAKKCRVGERAIQKVLRKLQDSGEIEVRIGHGLKTTTGHTNRYVLLKYQEWVNVGTPQPARGERGDTPGVNSGTPQGVNVGTPKPSVLTISKPSVKSKGARVDHSPVAQRAAPTVPTPPPPALTQSEIDGFAEATNIKATAPPPPCDAPPPDALGFRYASDDPPTGPKHRQFDPRQLVGGLYPAGFGQTAYEIYRESFAVTPTHKQIQHMTANVSDLDKWRTITEACALKGWKSYSNVFDAYQNGFREQKGIISDGNGGKNFGRSNGQNNPAAFAQPGPKRFDPYDRSTWDREMLATFDPISLAEIEQEERERGLSSM